MPAVSVLLPVRDARPWLASTLDSISRQSLADFEIVAVNDGSTDGSGEWLENHRRRERRLRVIHQSPAGLPAALNAGLAAARGRWIARHDADDLSRRRRLELQRAHLAAHRDAGLVGCRVRIVPLSEQWVGMRRWAAWHNTLLSHEQMVRELLVDSPLAHGTAMFRRSVLERVGGWRDRGWPEDVDLWLRLVSTGVRFSKLPQTLYAWRQHMGSATRRDQRYGRERFDDLRVHALRAGLLAETSKVTVVGVGRGVKRWCARLSAEGYDVHPLLEGSPARSAFSTLRTPAVFVFGAPVARARWREALTREGRREGIDFVFVV